MYRAISTLLLLPCLVAGQVSASTADWAAVEALAKGERIGVALSNGKTLNGKIDHVTSEAVYVSSRSRTVEVRREEVSRLYRQKSGSGGKWALVGAAIGAAAGGVGGAATMERESGYAGAVAGTIALGGLLGGLIGYLLGYGKSVLVYRAPARAR